MDQKMCGIGRRGSGSQQHFQVKALFHAVSVNAVDLEMLEAVCDAVSVPVIASGGAGSMEDFVTLFKELPKVDAGLAASIFHFGEVNIKELKERLAKENIPMRL